MRHPLTLKAGTEILVLSVPTTWADVTLAQYIEWQESDKPDACALAGITQAQLDRLDWTDAAYLVNLLAFAAELPESTTTPGMTDPGQATFGQMRLASQHLEENPGHSDIWYAPYLYALYRCKEVFGRNDEGKEEAMRLAILEEPVSKCFGDLTFIWAAWLISTNATPPPPKTLASPPAKNTMRAWRNWVNDLAPSLRMTG